MIIEAHRTVLTRRETEIALLVGEGLTNKQIAERLGIADQTVRHTLVRVYLKTAARNRVELTRLLLTGAIVLDTLDRGVEQQGTEDSQ